MPTETEISYQTQNVSDWLLNDESLYLAAVKYAKKRRYSGKPSYMGFLRAAGLVGEYTPDGVRWDDTRVQRREMNEVIRELAND